MGRSRPLTIVSPSGQASDGEAAGRSPPVVLVEQPFTNGASRFDVYARNGLLLRVHPVVPGVRPDTALVEAVVDFLLSTHAYLRRAGDVLRLGSPTGLASVELVSRDVIDVILGLVAPGVATRSGGVDSDDRDWVLPVLSMLARLGLLAPRGVPDATSGWGFTDLLFHGASGHARLPDPTDRGPATSIGPAFHPLTFGDRLVFPRVSFDAAPHSAGVPDDPSEMSLPAVLERRRSVRSGDDGRPITFRQLGDLLGHAARVRRVLRAGEEGAEYDITARPYPAAGGLYPLEIYAIVRLCDGLDPGTYHYDPVTHALESAADPGPRAAAALADAAAGMGGAPEPQVLLVITARPARSSWKYAHTAYALLLKEVGALMQTLYLVATWLRLAPCALGSGDGMLVRPVHDPDADPAEVSVGAFCVSSLPVRSETQPD